MAENKQRTPRGGRGPMGGGMAGGEKAKDFKGTIKKLVSYMAEYKIAVLFVMIFAAASTVFNIWGPKILSKAITELFNGLIKKYQGTGSINFDKIGQILLFYVGFVFSRSTLWCDARLDHVDCYSKDYLPDA